MQHWEQLRGNIISNLTWPWNILEQGDVNAQLVLDSVGWAGSLYNLLGYRMLYDGVALLSSCHSAGTEVRQQRQPCFSTHLIQEASDKRCAKLIWLAFIDMESMRTMTDFWAFIQAQVFAAAFIVCPLCFLQVFILFRYCFRCSYFVSTWVLAGASVCRNRGWGWSRVTWVNIGFLPPYHWVKHLTPRACIREAKTQSE